MRTVLGSASGLSSLLERAQLRHGARPTCAYCTWAELSFCRGRRLPRRLTPAPRRPRRQTADPLQRASRNWPSTRSRLRLAAAAVPQRTGARRTRVGHVRDASMTYPRHVPQARRTRAGSARRCCRSWHEATRMPPRCCSPRRCGSRPVRSLLADSAAAVRASEVTHVTADP